MELFNLPTLLTLIRLIISPLALPLLFGYLLPLNIWWLNVSLAILFIFFSLTDFFDGYLARRYNQETLLGKILDPLADKFLMYSTLIALLAAGKIYFYWVVLLIGREFFIMGLRQVALEHRFVVNVSFLGKVKTTIQMICLTVIILNPYQDLGIDAFKWNATELLVLMATLICSFLSAQQYHEEFMHKFNISKQKLLTKD